MLTGTIHTYIRRKGKKDDIGYIEGSYVKMTVGELLEYVGVDLDLPTGQGRNMVWREPQLAEMLQGQEGIRQNKSPIVRKCFSPSCYS